MVFFCLYFTLNVLMLNLPKVTGQVTELTDNFLLVTDTNNNNVYGISLETGQTNSLFTSLPSGTNPIAVTYDPINRIVYWSAVGIVRSISKYSLATLTNSTVYVDYYGASAVFDGLTIDPYQQIIYFADAGYGRVGQISSDGSGYRIISDIGGSLPRGIVFDQKNSWLYWTDWSSTFPAIYRAPTSTGTTTTLVSGNLLWPNALTIDFYNGVMYWGDAGLHKIEMANIDGTGRTVLIQSTSARYYGMSLDSSYVYYTDWTLSYIMKMDRKTFSTSAVASTGAFGRLNGIILYNSTDRRTFGNYTPRTTVSTSPSPTRTTTTSYWFWTRSPDSTTTTSSYWVWTWSAETPSTTTTTMSTTTSYSSWSWTDSPNSSNSNTVIQGNIALVVAVFVGVAVIIIVAGSVIAIVCVIIFKCRPRTPSAPPTQVNLQRGVIAVSELAAPQPPKESYRNVTTWENYAATVDVPIDTTQVSNA